MISFGSVGSVGEDAGKRMEIEEGKGGRMGECKAWVPMTFVSVPWKSSEVDFPSTSSKILR
jgi:hypothetical protein